MILPAARLVEEEVEAGGCRFRLRRPADPDALVDERAFRHAEFMPYWAELWPSGLALAKVVAAGEPGRLLELGCGLGLPSLVAARRGWDVVATDWSAHAIAVLTLNAAANGVRLRAEVATWENPSWFEDAGPFDRVAAADVLYERRNVGSLLDLLGRLGTEVLLADPGRAPFDDFLEGAAEAWCIDDVAPEVVRLRPRRAAGANLTGSRQTRR